MTIRKTIISLLAYMFVTSCVSENSPIFYGRDDDPTLSIADEWSVSEEDISNVIEGIGLAGKSRMQDYSIATIYDSKDKPSIYVVNFGVTEGYALISATKKYDPVLAYSYKGHYNVGVNKPAGLIDWEKEMCENIECVDEMSADSLIKYSKLWKHYLEPKNNNNFKGASENHNSRSMDSYELGEVMDAYVNMCNNLRNQGYEILEMSNLSEQENSMVKEYVDEMTYPDYEDIRYQICIVASKSESKTTFIDNFVKTTWEQQNGFNSEFPSWNGEKVVAGCVAVAAGQIMRYYKHPARFDWENMPLNSASATTSRFLFELAYAANPFVMYGQVGAETKDMDEVFKKFEYKSERGKLSESKVYENLKKKKPVFLSGYAEDNGHAWVASGYKNEIYYSKKQLFIIAWPNKYDSVLTFDENSFAGPQYVYCNWGYNDGYDGFYKLSYCTSKKGKEYSENREMIYNIEPIK